MSVFRCQVGWRAVLVAVLLLSCSARAGWRAVEAELRFRPNAGNLAGAGVPLAFTPNTVDEDGVSLVFAPDRWDLAKPENGFLPGGWADFPAAFTLSNRTFRSVSWVTLPDGETARWTFRAEDGAEHALDFSFPHVHFDAATGLYQAPDMDVTSVSLLPGGVGRGLLAGAADLTVQFRFEGVQLAAANDCITDVGPSDLWLDELTAPLQGAREPGVRVAIAPAARLRNIGAFDVRWEWAIAPLGGNGLLIGPHPFLVMHYYRIRDGRIEQVGVSDVKHAWNSTNQGCGCPSGQVMYQGCSDVYSSANNLNQFYFGPREEVTAHTAGWTSLGSHFDGTPVDNFRDHTNVPGSHDAYTHRLVVPEPVLTATGGTHWVEAWYLSAQETNHYNNIAHRRVNPALVTSTWQFTTTGVTTNGPALDAWVPRGSFTSRQRHESVDTGEGRVHAAVKVQRLPSGRFRYDYAVFNFDYDRAVSALRVPVRQPADVTAMGVFDGDGVAGNNWSNTVHAAAVSWSGLANPLRWGRLTSFSLESADPPGSTNLVLEVANPAVPGQTLSLPTLAPTALRLVNFTLAGGAVRWASLPGATYRVQRAAAPDASVWSDAAAPVTATGGETAVTVDAEPGPATFYRVLLENP